LRWLNIKEKNILVSLSSALLNDSAATDACQSQELKLSSPDSEKLNLAR
jgi:hypothetical protein